MAQGSANLLALVPQTARQRVGSSLTEYLLSDIKQNKKMNTTPFYLQFGQT